MARDDTADRKKLASQTIKEITKGKSGSSEYGNWTLYKIKLAQRKESFSWFASDSDIIPKPGNTILYLEYVEDVRDKGTYYTIKKLELEENGNVATHDDYIPQKTNNDYNKSRDIGILTSYAKDIFLAKMAFDKLIQEMSVPEICKQSVLCGLAMYNKLNGIESKPKPQTKSKNEPKNKYQSEPLSMDNNGINDKLEPYPPEDIFFNPGETPAEP